MIHKITGRHMDVTEALRDYAEKKLERLQRYYNRISEIELVMDGDGPETAHEIELIVTVDHHSPFIIREAGADMYASLDTAVDRMERQLTRFKERTRQRKGHTGVGEATIDIMESAEEEERPE